MRKTKGPRGNAGQTTDFHLNSTTRVELAITLGVWSVIEREGKVRLSSLRAMARDWATRTEVLRAVNELGAAKAIRVSADATGPTIEALRGGGR